MNKVTLFLFAIALLLIPGQIFANSAKLDLECSYHMSRAYSMFLLGKIDSAIFYYEKVIETGKNDVQPYLGLMDCYFMQKDFGNAIKTGIDVSKKHYNFEVLKRIALNYAAKKNRSAVDSIYNLIIAQTAKEYIPDYLLSEFIMQIGQVFLQSYSYDNALIWFHRGDSLFNNDEFKTAIKNTAIHKKTKVQQDVNIMGGLIDYKYCNSSYIGYYSSVMTGILLRNKHNIELGYSYLRIKIRKENESDSLTNETEDEKNKEKDKDDQDSSTGKLDTNDISESQHDFYINYMNNSLLRNTSLSAALRMKFSNFMLSDNVITAYLGHITNLQHFAIGLNWYYTYMNSGKLLQFSPKIAFSNKFKNKKLFSDNPSFRTRHFLQISTLK